MKKVVNPPALEGFPRPHKHCISHVPKFSHEFCFKSLLLVPVPVNPLGCLGSRLLRSLVPPMEKSTVRDQVKLGAEVFQGTPAEKVVQAATWALTDPA